MERFEFMLMDVDSGNSLGTFGDRARAEAVLRRLVEETPELADTVALVVYDKEGFAVNSSFVGDLDKLQPA
ncbi:MAG: hypothetical protein WD276_09300 [Actinomycetota bacterium]